MSQGFASGAGVKPDPPKLTVITASDSAWAPSAGVRAIRFRAIGGGGGGGGTSGGGTGAANAGAGGGGGYCEKLVTTIDATYNITIGAGGSGGAAGNNNGSAGGDTTIVGSVGPGTNVNMSANGGGFGQGMAQSTGNATTGRGTGGTATGGDINIVGSDGSIGRVLGGESVRLTRSGAGGAGLGGGDRSDPTNATTTGANGRAYGGGGTGAKQNTSTNQSGGDGADGVVIVEEYF